MQIQKENANQVDKFRSAWREKGASKKGTKEKESDVE